MTFIYQGNEEQNNTGCLEVGGGYFVTRKSHQPYNSNPGMHGVRL